MQNLSKNTKPTIFRITGSISNFFEYYYYYLYLVYLKRKTVAPEITAVGTIAASVGFYGVGISQLFGYPFPGKESAIVLAIFQMIVTNMIFNDNRRKAIYAKFSSNNDINFKDNKWKNRACRYFVFISFIFMLLTALLYR